MEGKEIAKPTPSEKFISALKEYAQSQYPNQPIIISDWAAVFYVETVDEQGGVEGSYLHITSERSSWHSLRGLVQTLADYVYRSGRK